MEVLGVQNFPCAEYNGVMSERSPQTLSEADRRLVAAWAADCAERVLGLFEAEAPDDDRPRTLIARTRAFARGELNTAEEIRRRFAGSVGASDVKAPAAAAAARAAGQAVAICHMGAHALGAAAYAVEATGLANQNRPEAVEDEIRWQLDHMSPEVRAALRALPPIGENSSGPLGPGLLASGRLGTIVRELQAGITQTEEQHMQQNEGQKHSKKSNDSKDNNFTETVKIMANTPPISNDEIIKRSKKNKK